THGEPAERDDRLLYADELTAEARALDAVDGAAAVEAALRLAADLDEAAGGAVLGLGTGVDGQRGAGKLAPAVVLVGPVDLVTHIAADLQAGLGPRDVEEAGAVDVADTHIFHRLRLGNGDDV